MTTIDRKVQELIDDVSKRLLTGRVEDFTVYARFTERYKVLKELERFLAENREIDADDGELTDDVQP